ncbi:MAG: SH3 domain-containing protein [Clostridiales bacterium]|nr:SH3 domain-containing protein [Clostridiales bacterium]
MVPVRKILTTLALTTGSLALMTSAALATDVADILCQATLNTDCALLEEADSQSDEVVALETGDEVVLLSRDGELAEAAYEDGDEVYTGYLSLEDVTLESRGTAQLLSTVAILRETPSDEGDPVGLLNRGDELEILGYGDGWYLVSVGDDTGYLHLEDVDAEVVTTTKLNLREEASTRSKVCDVLSTGTELELLSAEEDGWVEVSYEDETGYVSVDYLTASEEYIVDNPVMTAGEAVLAYAQQFLGNRYVWGGTSLTNGCDCSGYVMKIFAAFGVSLPHSSYAIRNYGTAVSYSDIQVGDVVCYSGHVGIYAGNGQIINALNSRKGICYTSVNFSKIITIRRLV